MRVATFGKGMGTGNIMKQSRTNSGEHLHLVLDLPPSFVTLRFNEIYIKKILKMYHLHKAIKIEKAHPKNHGT